MTFVGAVTLSLVIYGLTVPDGLPWGQSTHLALAYLGEVVRPPAMQHPAWGRFVEVFGSHIALSCVCAALAAGLLAALVNRYLGWRVSIAAALVWIFMPGVWNRAVTGEHGVVLAFLAVAAIWLANAIGLWAFGKLWALWRPGDMTTHVASERRTKINRMAGWALMGAAVLFALVSVSYHDSCLGEPATAYARGVVAEATGRIIVLNGLCDDQIGHELKRSKGADARDGFLAISLRTDGAYRTNLLAWVKRTWPGETNFWVAAEVSPRAFVQAARQKFPERFYLMNGVSTTPEGWVRRWKDFEPYLKTSDRFVAMAKLAFAFEGETVVKRLEQEGKAKDAKLLREQLPHVGKQTREKAVREVAKNENAKVASALMSLIEWNNEMTEAMDCGDLALGGRIARAILSNPQWSGFIPANAVMGSVAASEGDYTASAAFFRVAVSTTNAVPPIVLNDYADSLMRLGRLKEAEEMARRAVKQSDESFWLARLTLIEVLKAKYDRSERIETIENGEPTERYRKVAGAQQAEREVLELVQAIGRHAPKDVGEQIRKTHGRAW